MLKLNKAHKKYFSKKKNFNKKGSQNHAHVNTVHVVLYRNPITSYGNSHLSRIKFIIGKVTQDGESSLSDKTKRGRMYSDRKRHSVKRPRAVRCFTK